VSTQRKTLLAALAFLVPAAALIASPASAATQPIHKAKHHVVHKVSTHHAVPKKPVHKTAS
jgi:Spy/CpxP family protein refolding chaperone